jgi:L,D-peptidoglycan transpeptidase YkuD (ErfK/YbiS/YcfS/YnhG family)
MEVKPLTAGVCLLLTSLLLTSLCTACASVAPLPAPAPAAGTARTGPAGTAAARSRAAARPPAALARAVRCPAYPAAVYGTDPNRVPRAGSGGGTQLLTVTDPTAASTAGTFTAWARTGSGCWKPVSFPGQPAQPFRAQTGYGGLLPITRRVPGDWATPTGLFPLGTTIYGNSVLSPSTRYPYHHLACGDWWDEQPGSPAYDTFQHVPCGTTPPYGADSEALWTEIQPYQHFIDITMPHPPDHGAGIFLHDDMPEGYTEGCIALPDAELDAVLAWLNPARAPRILISIG